MAAIKTWAINPETGKVVNIRGERCEKYTCCGCGEVLIPHRGEKNDWFFAHKSVKECKGGTPETILHKLGKQILKESTTFSVPDGRVLVGKDISLSTFPHRDLFYLQGSVEIERSFGSFRPDAVIQLDGVSYFIELFVSHKVSEAKLNTMRKAISGDYVVIEIDLRCFYKNIDNIDMKELQQYILGNGEGKRIISSTQGDKWVKKFKDSIFDIPRGKLLCPAYDGRKVVVDSQSCRKCPFYIGNNKCTGYSCLSGIRDYIMDETKKDRLDFYDEYMPSAVGEVVYFNTLFGVCDQCGTALKLARGRYGVNIPGLQVLDVPTEYVYTYCPACGRYELVRCPDHGEGCRIRRNQSGVVYIECKYYKGRNYIPEDGEIVCKQSLSIYTRTPIKDNYTDEILAVGDISLWSANDSDAMDRLNKTKYCGGF